MCSRESRCKCELKTLSGTITRFLLHNILFVSDLVSLPFELTVCIPRHCIDFRTFCLRLSKQRQSRLLRVFKRHTFTRSSTIALVRTAKAYWAITCGFKIINNCIIYLHTWHCIYRKGMCVNYKNLNIEIIAHDSSAKDFRANEVTLGIELWSFFPH